ncbi:MAG: site-specific DNA-methyltransferase [Desulfamplus sp.]|nr:site-specific DNA-methyltransferase [Desulfamplus sp.]
MPTLTWTGKEKVINHHQVVPLRVLEHLYGFTAEKGGQTPETHSGNMIIHGDNLEGLKALLPKYEGKIKCIYIDPPYNTGNEKWVYNDNVNDPKFKKWLGQVVGKESEDLNRHDKWLCMMYPRLKLLHKLLAHDGSLVISIGYQEVFSLIHVCKEFFANKQIVCCTIQTSGGKPAGGFNYQHEYLIFVVPNEFEANPLLFSGGNNRTPFEGLTLATFDKTQRPNQTYPIFVNNIDGSLAGVGESLQERVKKGTYTGSLADFSYDFDEAPAGTIAIWPITSKGKDCVWRLISSRLIQDWEKGYIKISVNRSKDSKNKYSIQYLPEGVIKKIESGKLEVTGNEKGYPTLSFGDNKTVGSEIPTVWLEKLFFSVKGTTLINEIFGNKQFNYPKPLELITEIIRSISSPDDIILDSFAGSGTTAHAVLNLNKQDGGNRKFILIEMEDYAENITAERVKRVINGYGTDKNFVEGLGGSFDYYELGKPLFVGENQEFLNEDVEISKIREYVFYSETKASIAPEISSYNPSDEHRYYLGQYNGTAYYFIYEKDQTTTLNYNILPIIKDKAEQYIIYADNCLLSDDFMKQYNITFKKIPRDITRL